MLAVAVSADDANRHAVRVGRDDGMQAASLADSTQILEGFAGSIGSGR
jgi:hypothetical protein